MRKLYCVFLIVFLLIVQVGCRNSEKQNIVNNNTNQNNSTTTSQTVTNPPAVSDNQIAMEAYKTVLNNTANFYNTDDKKDFDLKTFLKEYASKRISKISRFAVLDMDGDKISEVVLELSTPDNPEFEVLHYNNGKVYGYYFVYRGLSRLKADGTSSYSNSAFDWGYHKLNFSTNGWESDQLGYCEPKNLTDIENELYYVNHKLVTKEEFESSCTKQREKEDATWYEFSSNNIETKLVVN